MVNDRTSKILFLSTYPPVKCGIASFTQDLVNAIDTETNHFLSIKICALDKNGSNISYGLPVSMTMDSYKLDSCIATAEKINRDASIKLVCIEHEFGLYGGDFGEYILGFLALLEKPFVIRFHTVLPSPEPKRLKIVQSISLLAERVIVMTHNSERLLKENYHIDEEKIIIIPHGTHNSSPVSASDLKQKYDFQNRLVLTTFGLLSPNKGIEKGILAMKEVSKKFPEALYVVLGQTHPNLIKEEGEKYRNFLQELIDANGLQESVLLVNEYASTKKLMEYLTLTDIYLFTSKDPNQAVSGTFLYAMSAGCPIISNSFVLAKEMLDETSGIIIDPLKENELADNIMMLLQNDILRKQMGHNAFAKMKNSKWHRVAQKHSGLFYDIIGKPVRSTDLVPQLMN
ncbi:MAG: glycosyltransferase [Chitinophagaceae bacterium]|nr:glycosyltransferase [Chitinophagaceae bacterium]